MPLCRCCLGPRSCGPPDTGFDSGLEGGKQRSGRDPPGTPARPAPPGLLKGCLLPQEPMEGSCALRAPDQTEMQPRGRHGALGLTRVETFLCRLLSRSLTQALTSPGDPQTWLWSKQAPRSRPGFHCLFTQSVDCPLVLLEESGWSVSGSFIKSPIRSFTDVC